MRRTTYQLTQPGWLIVMAIAVLVAMGIASIFVTDTHYAAGHDGPRNAAKQCVRVVAGCFAAMIILQIGYQRIARYSYACFLVTLVLLVPLLVAKLAHSSFGGLTAPRNGAYRWLHFPGFALQPSELLKLGYVLALAWYLRYRKNYRRFGGLLIPIVASVVPLVLILLEPDLGTALLLAPVLFTMLYAAGARVRHLIVLVLIALAGAPIAWGQIRGYQRARVTAVLLQSERFRRAVIEHPERFAFLADDPQKTRRQAIEWAAGSGYQLVHSKNAIGSGGVFGQGWGEGVYVRHGLLPDRHNDFIFAVIAHQWGLVGCLLVLTCYTLIVLAGIRIVAATADPFGRLVALGVVALIVTQVIINIGMTLGLMPTTGMTLPFVSYGGSSLLANFMAVALLISVAQSRPYLLATRPFEFHRRAQPRAHLIEHHGFHSGGTSER